jgi:hypothetical protein
MGERCRYRASWGESALSCTCHLKVSLFSKAVPALPTHQKSRNLHSCAWPLACCTVHSTREARATARGAPATCICDLWPPLSCSSRQERRAGRLRRGRSSPSPPARRQHPHGAFSCHPHGVPLQIILASPPPTPQGGARGGQPCPLLLRCHAAVQGAGCGRRCPSPHGPVQRAVACLLSVISGCCRAVASAASARARAAAPSACVCVRTARDRERQTQKYPWYMHN